MSNPDRADSRLWQAANRAFAWLSDNLEFFDPFKQTTPDVPRTGVAVIELDLDRSKALLELIYVCMYYKRLARDVNLPVDRCIKFAADIWRRPAFRDLVIRNPQLFRLYGAIYIALHECGVASDNFSDPIQRTLNQQYVVATEDLPFRRLELRYILDVGNLTHDLCSYRTLFESTLLAKFPALVYLTDEDAYSITHTIFYLTDFGHRQIQDTLIKAECYRVDETVGQLLGLYLRRRHWDLVAELLMASRCLRRMPTLVDNLAWKSLLDAQRPNGAVPGPIFLQEQVDNLSEEERRQSYFEEHYHTTLVTSLACFSEILLTGGNSELKSCPATRFPAHHWVTNTSPQSTVTNSATFFEQCLLWLQDSMQEIETERKSPTPILQGLVACWICEKRLFGDAGLQSTRRMACSLRAFLERNGTVELLRCNAALVLLGVGILRAVGIESKPLEGFAKKVAAASSGLEEGSQANLPDVYVSKFLLHRLGLGCEVRPMGKVPRLEALSTVDLWFADDELVESICGEIAAATAFGTCPLELNGSFNHKLTHVLSAWLIDYSHLYNLEIVCVVLRCMTYWRTAGSDESEEVSAWISFLAAQQQPDGRIGFFGPEVAKLAREHPGLDDVVDLYLPVMLTVVWTVFELTNGGSCLFLEIGARKR